MSRTYRLAADYVTRITHEKRWNRDDEFDPSKYFMEPVSWGIGEWDREFHQVPFRRKNRDLLSKILRGSIDPADAVFPPNARKPYKYYD